MRLPATLLAAASAVVVVACAAATPAALTGRTFLAVEATEDGTARPLVPGSQVRLSFEPDGRLGASAGCNSLGAAYRLDGGVLRMEPGAVTEMACEEPLMAQETWLFDFLASGPTATVTGTDLVLSGGGTVIRFLDREVAEPDLPLVGPVWTLTSLVSADAVSSVPLGVTASLVFGDDGSVAIEAGCNQGSAPFDVDGSALRFGPALLTKRACEAPAAEVESAVLAVLEAESVAFEIEASTLRLDGGAVGLELTGS